jgi:hypothetical protein
MGAPDVEGLPWPEGEPAALDGAAGKLRGIAGKLSAAGGPLGRAAGLGGWTGGASIASSLLLSAQVQSVQGAAEVFGSTATALSGLATLLSAGQDRIRALARDVRAAREAAEAAQRRAADAGRRMSADPDSTGSESAYLHLDAAAGQAQQHYREVRDRAVKQAAEIVSECKAADADTASEVAEAKVAATAGPRGLPAGVSQVDIEPVALAWLYAPHLRFHPDEQNLPTDLRTALARGSLVYRDGRWFLDLPDGDRSRGSTSAPVDFTVVERDGKRYLIYRVWYSYNNKGEDDHEGDLELFGVELGPDGKPAAALYYGHGTPHRVPWDQVPKQDGHPISYSAAGSHASYPAPGHYPIAEKFGVDLATDEAAAGGTHEDVEQHLRPGPAHYTLPGGRPIPAGARIGEDLSPIGGSPQAPDTGGNTEPFPAGSTPIEGAPETGDGLDGTIVGAGKDIAGLAESAAKAAATPITIGADAVGLIPGS